MADAPADDPRLITACWACGVRIRLPAEAVPEGKRACDIYFQCGGCQANNTPESRRPPPSRLSILAKRLVGYIFIVLVPADVVFIGIIGHWTMNPILFPGWPTAAGALFSPIALTHVAVSMFLEVQILWSYFACVFTAPGAPPALDFGSAAAASGRRLAQCSLCRRCARPRPAGAHHCSTCGTCTLGLDHHCLFANNCIGQDNRGLFVRFLLYSTGGTAYGVLTAFYARFIDRTTLYAMIWENGTGRATWKGWYYQIWFAAALFSLLITGIMLTTQVVMLLAETTQFEVMMHGSWTSAVRSALRSRVGFGARLREVLGEPLWMLLLPPWRRCSGQKASQKPSEKVE